ncbi:MAG: hypothetical protein H7A35_00180 [Planctomycetales bacterium]|nr:hypothetical protein [bacterium]UNM08479.1 MAG: hypothetical protein H7A35_00180 [Planctomycetales bacterium]
MDGLFGTGGDAGNRNDEFRMRLSALSAGFERDALSGLRGPGQPAQFVWLALLVAFINGLVYLNLFPAYGLYLLFTPLLYFWWLVELMQRPLTSRFHYARRHMTNQLMSTELMLRSIDEPYSLALRDAALEAGLPKWMLPPQPQDAEGLLSHAGVLAPLLLDFDRLGRGDRTVELRRAWWKVFCASRAGSSLCWLLLVLVPLGGGILAFPVMQLVLHCRSQRVDSLARQAALCEFLSNANQDWALLIRQLGQLSEQATSSRSRSAKTRHPASASPASQD